MDFRHMVQLWLLTLTMLSSFAFCKDQHDRQYWKVFPDTKNELKYQVLIKLSNRGIHVTTLGILLNDRYVLTMYENANLGRIPVKNFSIITNYHGKDIGQMQGVEHDVVEFFSHRRFVLLGTAGRIRIEPGKVTCIKLPTDAQVGEWMLPYLIPNNAQSPYRSSCWARTGKEAKLYVREGLRKCGQEDIYKLPSFLIASCIYKQQAQENCEITPGVVLEYNQTLIGVQYYVDHSHLIGTHEVPDPYGSPPYNIKYDVFMNTAYIVQWLRSTMIHYSSCERLLQGN